MDTRPEEGYAGLPWTGLRFAVVGAGRLGISLALALRDAGAQMTGYTSSTPAGRSRAEGWLRMPAARDLQALANGYPDLYAICVPDSALPAVAAGLASSLPDPTPSAPGARPDRSRPTMVLHTSGASSVAVLDPCAAAGALTLAFHPLQTFSEPGSGATRFTGCAVAITPSERVDAASAETFGFSLARSLHARPFLLEDANRPLYHAAACMASNYLVTLEGCAERLFVEAGMPKDEAMAFFLPLVRAAVDNLANQGPVDALTGPLSRGDTGTITGHLNALNATAPDLAAVYRCLGTATLDLVRAAGQVDPSTISELARLLGPSESTTKTL